MVEMLENQAELRELYGGSSAFDIHEQDKQRIFQELAQLNPYSSPY
jgi:hypothetical protein